VPFGWYLALRFLHAGCAQALLIVLGVAVGVAVQVFVSLLIHGLQEDLIDRTLGIQPHVTLSPREEEARPLLEHDAQPGTYVASRVEKAEQRLRSIEGWQRLTRSIGSEPGVAVVSERVSGPALAIRGEATYGVTLLGVVPTRFDDVVPITRNLVSGGLQLQPGDAVIGRVLAHDLGVSVGDLLRIDAGSTSERFTVRGIFDLGGQIANSQWVLLPLRAAQSLLGLPGGVTEIDLKVADVFEAALIAERLADRTGLHQQSWMSTNAQLLSALRSQSMSSLLIQLFVMCAVAMGIASVLVVSVMQMSGQIGILRAIGTRRSAVLTMFLLQGAMMGLAGAVLGTLAGSALVKTFHLLMRDARGGPLFRLDWDHTLFAVTFAVAVGTGLLAAVLPARRAARLDPAVAIRHE